MERGREREKEGERGRKREREGERGNEREREGERGGLTPSPHHSVNLWLAYFTLGKVDMSFWNSSKTGWVGIVNLG